MEPPMRLKVYVMKGSCLPSASCVAVSVIGLVLSSSRALLAEGCSGALGAAGACAPGAGTLAGAAAVCWTGAGAAGTGSSFLLLPM